MMVRLKHSIIIFGISTSLSSMLNSCDKVIVVKNKYINNIERRAPYRKEMSDETLRKLNDERRRRILKNQRKTI